MSNFSYHVMEYELRSEHTIGTELVNIILEFAFFRCSKCKGLTEEVYGPFTVFGEVKTMCWYCNSLCGEEAEFKFRTWDKKQL